MNYPKSNKRLFKDENPNAVVRTFLVLVFLIVAGFYGCAALMGCQKESSFTAPKGVIESDHHLKPAGGYSLAKRDYVAPEVSSKGKGRGKPVKPTTPTDTTTQQPPTVNAPVIYLDFDGQTVTGTQWNMQAVIACNYSGMNGAEIQATVARVQEDYSPFGVIVTADSAVYLAADPYKRVRVIITESWEWYGQAGGVAYLGSFSWGNETPAFVFSSLLGYSVKNVSDATSHEAGHTLGLRHQSKWEAGAKVYEYNPDIAPDGKGYLMGYPYDKVSGWQVGLNSYGQTQDDRSIIKSNL